jgi:ribosomal protein L37AE/L43A
VDYKTAKDIYIELMPYGEHEVQVNLYAFMLKEMGYPAPDEIFIQYVGMRGPYECKKCRQAVEWTPSGFQCLVCGKIYEKGHLGVALVPVRKYSDKEIREVLEHRRNLLQQAFEKKQLPAGEPGWICKYCQHECDMRGA